MAILKHWEAATKTQTYEFTTITDLVNYLREAPINGAFTSSGSRLSSQTTGNTWYGTKDYDEALRFLEFGWSAESEKLATKIKLAKQNNPTVSRRKVTQSVVGYTPIIPNYLAGIPLNMLNSKMTVVKQKVVTINKDISYHAGYSENEIEDNSIKAFQIIQALEANGVRCNLNVILGIDTSSAKNVRKMIVKVRIKGSGEKFNISKASFGLVNPGMLRRVMFRLIETAQEFRAEDKGICFGYGSPTDESFLKSLVEKQKQYYMARDIRNAETEAKNFCK